MGKKLYVGNMSYDVDSTQLEQMFAPHGTVTSADVLPSLARWMEFDGGGAKHKSALRIAVQADICRHRRILQRHFLLAGDEAHGAFEAGGIAGGKQLLGIGGAALAAEFLRRREVEAEQAIIAPDVAGAAADGASLGGVECRHFMSPFNLYTIS